MKNSFIKDALILFVITFILGILLSFVEQITEKPIAIANENAKQESYKAVCSAYVVGDNITNNIDVKSDKASLNEVLVAKDSNGEEVGYITTTTVKGYGGNITIITGFDNDLKITGISYPETLSETPGLGMKVTDEDKFINHYIGTTGNNIINGYTISGATISSSAVREGLKLAYNAVSEAKGGK